MPKFQIVNSNQVPSTPGWVNATKFNSNMKVVDRDGNTPKVNYYGTVYQLVAKKERAYSCPYRCFRAFIGILSSVATLGAAWLLSKSIRDLVCKSKESIRYGIPLSQASNQPQPGNQPKPTVSSSAAAPAQTFHATSSFASAPYTSYAAPISGSTLPSSSSGSSPAASQPGPSRPLNLIPSVSSLGQTTLGTSQSALSTYSAPFPSLLTSGLGSSAPGASLVSSVPTAPQPPKDPLEKASWLHSDYPNDFHKFELERFIAGEKVPTRHVLYSFGGGNDADNDLNEVQARLDLWDKNFQLKARLQRHPNSGLTLNDLFQAKSFSRIRYALPLDGELEKLTLQDLKIMKPDLGIISEVWQCQFDYSSAERKGFDSSKLTQHTVLDISVMDIPALKAADINRLMAHLPEEVFCLINPSEVPQIDVQKLTDPQCTALLTSKTQAQALQPAQLTALVPKLGAKELKYLQNLTDTQLLSIDFDKRDCFSRVFYLSSSSFYSQAETARTQRLMSKLSSAQIEQWHHHFDAAHWKCLSEQQVEALDFSKINKVRGDDLNQYFKRPISEKGSEKYYALLKRLMQKNNNEYCPLLLPHLESNVINMLFSDGVLYAELVLESGCLTTKQRFDKVLYQSAPHMKTVLSTFTRKELLQYQDFMGSAHWRALPKSLVYLASDIRFNKENVSALFDVKTGDWTLLYGASAAKIQEIAPHLTLEQWRKLLDTKEKILSTEQILAIDLLPVFQASVKQAMWSSSRDHTSQLFDIIFDPNVITDRYENRADLLMKQMTLDLLEIVKGYLTAKHWEKVTGSHISQLKLDQRFLQGLGKAEFYAIFPRNAAATTELIQKLDSNGVYALAQHFYYLDWYWDQLTDEQCSQLDLNRSEITNYAGHNDRLSKLREAQS